MASESKNIFSTLHDNLFAKVLEAEAEHEELVADYKQQIAKLQKDVELAKTLKGNLIFMADKMNEFNIKYDEQKLHQIHNEDINNLFIQQEIDNAELSAKTMIKKLQDIKNYVLSVTKPDVSKYKEWDLNTMMIWINHWITEHILNMRLY